MYEQVWDQDLCALMKQPGGKERLLNQLRAVTHIPSFRSR
jgi:hypothetical protein